MGVSLNHHTGLNSSTHGQKELMHTSGMSTIQLISPVSKTALLSTCLIIKRHQSTIHYIHHYN